MAPWLELLNAERANQHIQIFASDDSITLELRSGTQIVFYSFKDTPAITKRCQENAGAGPH